MAEFGKRKKQRLLVFLRSMLYNCKDTFSHTSFGLTILNTLTWFVFLTINFDNDFCLLHSRMQQLQLNGTIIKPTK